MGAVRAPVILGARQFEMVVGYREFANLLAVIDTAGAVAATYQKRNLVPFGEYVRSPRFSDRLGIQGLAAELSGDTCRARMRHASRLRELPPFHPSICYETIFPHHVRGGAPRADWIVQITNDAWFGAFSGPYQHLAQARFRAIEQGLPLARSANTGVSAVIDPWGRVVASIALGENGHLDARLPAPIADTPYARAGDVPLALALAAMIAGLGGSAVVARRRG